VLIQAGAGGYSLAGGQVILKGGIGGTGIMVGQPDDGAAGTAGILIATVPQACYCLGSRRPVCSAMPLLAEHTQRPGLIDCAVPSLIPGSPSAPMRFSPFEPLTSQTSPPVPSRKAKSPIDQPAGWRRTRASMSMGVSGGVRFAPFMAAMVGRAAMGMLAPSAPRSEGEQRRVLREAARLCSHERRCPSFIGARCWIDSERPLDYYRLGAGDPLYCLQ
jgi:hypothetical protein